MKTNAKAGNGRASDSPFENKLREMTGSRNENTTATVDRPEWVRIPKVGERERFTGVSRATLYRAITGRDAPVKSALIRRPGCVSGVRLIHLPSLLNWVEGMLNNPAGGTDATTGTETQSHE